MIIKETVSVLSSDPLCRDDNARFKTVSLKPLSDQKCRRFPESKSVKF